MKKKVIKFAIDDQLWDISIPKPTKSYLPQWFKDTERLYDLGSDNPSNQGKTFKVCMPFTDSMISGYIFELWADLKVVDTEGIKNVYWKDESYQVLTSRDSGQTGKMTLPAGYSDQHFALRHPLFIQTPPGYSILVTQPFNRFDLPFHSLTAIIDSDKTPFFPGNFSLFIKEDFEGLIPVGTPLFQIIPFKRDEWSHQHDQSITKSGWFGSNKSGRQFLGWYRDNVWSKKSYE